LQGALDQVFSGNNGAVLTGNSGGSSNTSVMPITPSTNVSGTGSAALKAALAAAQSAMADSQAALRNGDFTAYGAAQNRLKAAIAAAIAAQK